MVSLKAAVPSGRTDWLHCLQSWDDLMHSVIRFGYCGTYKGRPVQGLNSAQFLCFHVGPYLVFSRNVILLHSTAGRATKETIFFIFSVVELVVAEDIKLSSK